MRQRPQWAFIVLTAIDVVTIIIGVITALLWWGVL